MEWRLPLSPAILNDPAFSPDPRAHPHFPLPLPLPSLPKPKPKLKPTSRRRSMKALVRGLISRHNLDRIDELDETDPFGTNYHHDGPYEVTGATPHIPAPPIRQVCQVPAHVGPKSMQHPSQHKSPPPQVPFIHAGEGLSLHLEPGQILQHNTIYTSHAHFPGQSNLVLMQPDHLRGQSTPNPRPRFLQDDLHNRPLLPPRAPPEHYPTDNIHHDHDKVTISPPPRHDSLLRTSRPSRSPQRTPPPSNPTSRKTQATESTTFPLPPYDSRHKSTRSLDSPSIINNSVVADTIGISAGRIASPAGTQLSSGIHLEHPRIRHLPKRLVMPTPLQSQPQTQHKFPSAEPVARLDAFPDHHVLETNFEAQLAIHAQGPRLLRKKSSAFPEKQYLPIPQDDAIPTMATGTTTAKTVNVAEGTKERIRRRKLSKRKSDVPVSSSLFP